MNEYNLNSDEEVTRLAEDYAIFCLIKRYLDTKDIRVLEELKNMLHKSIQNKKGKVFEKPMDIPIQNEKSSIVVDLCENITSSTIPIRKKIIF